MGQKLEVRSQKQEIRKKLENIGAEIAKDYYRA